MAIIKGGSDHIVGPHRDCVSFDADLGVSFGRDLKRSLSLASAIRDLLQLKQHVAPWCPSASHPIPSRLAGTETSATSGKGRVNSRDT